MVGREIYIKDNNGDFEIYSPKHIGNVCKFTYNVNRLTVSSRRRLCRVMADTEWWFKEWEDTLSFGCEFFEAMPDNGDFEAMRRLLWFFSPDTN